MHVTGDKVLLPCNLNNTPQIHHQNSGGNKLYNRKIMAMNI